MATDTTKPLTMTTEQVSRFHEVLRGEHRFRWDAACGRIPGRNDGAAGMRIKRKEAEAIDDVIGVLDGMLGLDETETFRATSPVAIPRGLTHDEVAALANFIRTGSRDNPYDSPEEYMFHKAHVALGEELGAALGAWEQANPLPPPGPPPQMRVTSMSLHGKVVWEPGMSNEESRARMAAVIREVDRKGGSTR